MFNDTMIEITDVYLFHRYRQSNIIDPTTFLTSSPTQTITYTRRTCIHPSGSQGKFQQKYRRKQASTIKYSFVSFCPRQVFDEPSTMIFFTLSVRTREEDAFCIEKRERKRGKKRKNFPFHKPLFLDTQLNRAWVHCSL